MSEIAEPNQILDLADLLIEQIKNHALTVSATRQSADVIPVVNALRNTARRYVQAVSSQTGWGNVFDDLERDEGEGAEEKISAPDESLQQPIVSYQAEYRLLIRDFNAARYLLQQKSTVRGKAICDDYDESYSGVVAGLAEVDGWDPYRYDQRVIQVLSAKWDSRVEGDSVVDTADRRPPSTRDRRRRPS